MRLTIRGNKRGFVPIFRYCLFIGIICSIVNGDRSTLERIRKHQEWLQKRNQQKQNSLSVTNYKKPSDVPKLWRFSKNDVKKLNTSLNEVYPENETIVTTTISSQKPIQSTSSTVEESTTKSNLLTVPPTGQFKVLETTTHLTNSSPSESTTQAMMVTEFSGKNDNKTENSIEAIQTDSLTSTNTPTTIPPTTTEAVTLITTSTFAATPKPKPKIRLYPRWGNWSQWSECSRSCGGGVKYQERKCINRNASGKRYVSNECMGVNRRYQLCNEESCGSEELDFRSQQCAAFNDFDFQGRKYSWEPYIKDDAECELNCKPMGMKYFATLNATVIDGTQCEKPAEYYRSNYRGRAICVGGICKAIHSSGIINGLSANSGAVSCGGLLCRPVTGIFTRDPLPEDAYVHVAIIPAGSSNISITELKNSVNLLVLRTEDQKYIFNGDNVASESGAYEAAEAIFDYHRIDGLQHGEGVTEWITCTGPIRENLELMIYSKSVNPGIKYEYLLPIISESEENELSLESDGFLKAGDADENSLSSSSRPLRRRKYNWKVIGFSSCTKSCGGGTQKPIVRCVRENFPQRYYSQKRCTHAEKPVLNENLLRCNTQPCPAYWRIDEWGDCHCFQGEGYRQREVSCVQELTSGIVIHVDNAACLEEQPPLRRPCDCPKNRRRSHGRYRTHNSNGTHLSRTHRDKSGIWLISDWNQYCSAECGAGIEYRTIFCDRSKINSERCDPLSTPELTRPCESQQKCNYGEWFAGPWTPCNGNCFNLTRSRQILCIQNQLIVDEEDCKSELKPSAFENCSHEEIEYCGAKWHYSDWTECSKSCDNGTQRRFAKCLEYNANENILKESKKCRYSLREPIYRACNTRNCEVMEPSLELLQNDICIDQFNNCKWAARAKLCSFDYYKNNCCSSCSDM